MAWSRCNECDTAFTSLSAFDKHIEGIEPTVHHPPESVGLEWSDERNAWRHKDEGQFDKLNGVSKNDAPVKVYNCASCGGEFTKLPGRGRPPKNCSNCGGKGVPKN